MFVLALAAAALYWEWTEARNVSLLPAALGRPEAGLNETYLTAEGVIVSPVERDGDRVDFTLKLAQIGGEKLGQDDGESVIEQAREGSDAQGDIGHGDNVGTNPAGELIAVQIKLQAESEIALAAQWQRGDRVTVQGELGLPAIARNFGGFDYRAYLQTQQVHWLLKGKARLV